jgi:uncharacterized protein
MIILDTSFLVSYWVETDNNHSIAKRIYEEKIKGNLFGEARITDYVFDETVTMVFYRTKSLTKAVIAGDNLEGSMRMIEVDDMIYDDSWNIFKSQKGTKLSFTDCTIISTMKLHGIEYIATFDRDFRKVDGVKVVDS